MNNKIESIQIPPLRWQFPIKTPSRPSAIEKILEADFFILKQRSIKTQLWKRKMKAIIFSKAA